MIMNKLQNVAAAQPQLRRNSSDFGSGCESQNREYVSSVIKNKKKNNTPATSASDLRCDRRMATRMTCAPRTIEIDLRVRRARKARSVLMTLF